MDLLKITYSNEGQNINGLIFQDAWIGKIYLDTDIDLITPEYEMEVNTDLNLKEIPVSKTLKKYMSFSCGVKSYVMESLLIASLCNNVNITSKSGQEYKAIDLTIETAKKIGSYYDITMRFYEEIQVNRGLNEF